MSWINLKGHVYNRTKIRSMTSERDLVSLVARNYLCIAKTRIVSAQVSSCIQVCRLGSTNLSV